MIVLSRKIMKKLEPIFTTAQKQAQARQFKLGIKTLEEILPMANWQVMLGAQIHSQIGVFHYADKKEDLALEHLKKGSVRSPDSQLMFGHRFFRRDQWANCQGAGSHGSFQQEANARLQCLCLHAQYEKGRRRSHGHFAKGLEGRSGHEATQDNLIRLQNKKKMNMKPFGMNWYTLQLEKPSAVHDARSVLRPRWLPSAFEEEKMSEDQPLDHEELVSKFQTVAQRLPGRRLRPRSQLSHALDGGHRTDHGASESAALSSLSLSKGGDRGQPEALGAAHHRKGPRVSGQRDLRSL